VLEGKKKAQYAISELEFNNVANAMKYLQETLDILEAYKNT
jgi:hypothetical protein